jgi:serine/threonine protein kinase/tetratricopeptide (TPR) repeat protein
MEDSTQPAPASARIPESRAKCARCGATTRLEEGVCLHCFLGEGLEADTEGSRQKFESVLAQDDVPDEAWRLGHYEILEEIGRGGMGVIYRARQQHSRRIVAVKRILAYQVESRETLLRFRREAEAAASLDHPNVLPIYEVDESEDGLPFFSMKYATGGSLRAAASALQDQPNECVRLMAKVARAIDYAHSHGILHRDLQPGNILLDGDGEPLVSDFGLAKWLEEKSDLTRTLTTFGTPGYIAPEQAECAAAELTPAADIYSLGAILFYLLTGRPPFVGANVLSVIHQAGVAPAPRLRSLAPSLDRDLETVVARCLESEPHARYRSAGALAEDLERCLDGRPILAHRVLPPARIWRWSRRNPILAGAATTSLLLAAVVIWLLRVQSDAPPREPPPEKSIAVLPFQNLSNEKGNTFLADGVHDEIITDLAKVADLRVISRTSVMGFRDSKRNLRDIAQELGVAHIVEGSVQRAADGRVRVSAQLIDARTDAHLWAERYDRELADIFSIQSEIATAIADHLEAKLSPNEKRAIEKPPTSDLIAFDLYSRAKTLYDSVTFSPAERQELVQGIDLLNQAVARDPSFFQAYCVLAYTHDYVYFSGVDHTAARLGLAERALVNAFRLQPEAGEAHLARAQHRYLGYLDYESASRELEIARRTLPNDPRVFALTGYIQRRQGRREESLRNLKRSVDLDPRNLLTLQQVGLSYHDLRRYRDAAATYDRALALDRDNRLTQLVRAHLDLDWKANTRPLHQAIDFVRKKDPAAIPSIAVIWLDCALAERDLTAAAAAVESLGDSLYFGDDSVQLSRRFGEGLLARIAKDEVRARAAFTAARAEQEKLVQAQPDFAPALCVLALIDAGLGRKEEALREGQRAVEMLPVEKDSVNGAHMIEYCAVIAAWVGEKKLACEQLQTAARLDGVGLVTYGKLKLSPFWDPLRADPCFERVVASLAPKL